MSFSLSRVRVYLGGFYKPLTLTSGEGQTLLTSVTVFGGKVTSNTIRTFSSGVYLCRVANRSVWLDNAQISAYTVHYA